MKVVAHSEIFHDKSALPTFSSPSIELNLHHIDALSEYFIYFNDDVFLGSPVFPYDFMSLQYGQFLFSSWSVPSCAKNCSADRLSYLQVATRSWAMASATSDAIQRSAGTIWATAM